MTTCDFCGRKAEYDGKTGFGAWAAMCTMCFYNYGIGLGTGKGQKIKTVTSKTTKKKGANA